MHASKKIASRAGVFRQDMDLRKHQMLHFDDRQTLRDTAER
jgi:hypothetical protein